MQNIFKKLVKVQSKKYIIFVLFSQQPTYTVKAGETSFWTTLYDSWNLLTGVLSNYQRFLDIFRPRNLILMSKRSNWEPFPKIISFRSDLLVKVINETISIICVMENFVDSSSKDQKIKSMGSGNQILWMTNWLDD